MPNKTHAEPTFRLRPRRPRRQQADESKAWSRSFKGLMRIVQMSTKPSRARHSRAGSGSCSSARPAMRQRCAVRVTYSPNRVRGQWAAHGRYVARERATKDLSAKCSGFTADADGIDIAKTLDGWQKAGDERVFKLIVSPEFGERIDLKWHTRALMARIAQDVGAPLEWAAVTHYNTGHPHVHIALRGQSGTGPIRFAPEFIKHGIRQHAEALCTARLGFRTQVDALEAERREIELPRFTSLDRQIGRLRTRFANLPSAPADGFVVIADPTASGLSGFQRARQQHLASRLRSLERMGLASPGGAHSWNVRSEFEAVLRSMQKAQDRQSMLAAHAALLSDPRLPLQYTSISDLQQIEGRVLGHALDEASGKTLMLLEGTDAKVHFISHSLAIEQARARGALQPGNFARVKKRHSEGRLYLEVFDYGDAEMYLKSLTLRRSAQRQNAEPGSSWGGWLGCYREALEANRRHPKDEAERIGGRL